MGSWVSCWLSAIIVTKQPNLKFRRIEGAVTETHRLPAQLGSKEDESLAVGEGHDMVVNNSTWMDSDPWSTNTSKRSSLVITVTNSAGISPEKCFWVLSPTFLPVPFNRDMIPSQLVPFSDFSNKMRGAWTKIANLFSLNFLLFYIFPTLFLSYIIWTILS